MSKIDINEVINDGGDLLSSVTNAIFDITFKNTTVAVSGLKDHGNHKTPEHLYVALAAAAGAINLAAKIMTMPGHDHDEDVVNAWAEGPPDRVAVVAAALLMARCFIPMEGPHHKFEFNPINIKAALEATAKILGTKNESVFAKGMVEAANSFKCPDHFLDNSLNTKSTDSGNDDMGPFRTLN